MARRKPTSAGEAAAQARRNLNLAGTSTAPRQRSQAPNQIWGIDLQHDATENDRPVTNLHVIDKYTREPLSGIVARSTTGHEPADHLHQIATQPGTSPATRRLDNRPATIPTALTEQCPKQTGTLFSPTQPTLTQPVHQILQIQTP